MVWDVDREIFTLFGGLALRWYSLLFALGIVVGYFIVQDMFKKEGKPLQLLDSLLFHVVIGTVVGARLGHCLLYEPGVYLQDPIRILKIWEGGLASHGGFTGVMIALILYVRKYPEISFFWVADRMTVPAMLTAGFIRVGNFFNSEILGKEAAPDFPLGVIFKHVDNKLRHPTQIYEALGYLTVCLIQYLYYRGKGRHPKEGKMFGLVLILGYGFRLFIENFKEVQESFENDLPLNMGQLLSIPFILLGFFFFFGGHYKVPFLRRGLSADAAPVVVGSEEPTAAGESRRGQLRKQTKKLRK